MPNAAHSRALKADRRFTKRETMVLRIGLLEMGGKSAFCLVKNISAFGVQVKLYSAIPANCEIWLTVGDENPMRGTLVWVRDQLGGIRFDERLEPSTLLRVTQKLLSTKRRSSPRVNAVARAILRTGGKTISAELCDISASGARLRTGRRISTGPHVQLTLPGMPAIRAHVRWAEEDEVGLSFETPVPIGVIAGWLSDRLRVWS